MTAEVSDNSAELEAALAHPRRECRYTLRLYVTGMSPRSTEAFANIKALCEEKLAGRYDLEVIDIYQHPHLARQEQIVAVPTLVKSLPPPCRRLIGNLSVRNRVLAALDLSEDPGGRPA